MLTYEIKHTPEAHLITLRGAINEMAADVFAQLAAETSVKPWILHLAEIDSINSLGIKVWTNFLRKAQESRPIVLSHCSPVFVLQMNTFSSFTGACKIESFYGAFYCPQCDAEDTHFFEANKSITDLIEETHHHQCAQCGSLMEFEEDYDFFFKFLG